MSIKYINIVHHSHTDFGYTDHPLRARELQKQYIGRAVDYALDSRDKTPPFAWTCEVLLPLWDWWRQASAGQQARLLQAEEGGMIAVMGLPFNITAFLDSREWDYLMHWIPEDLWKALHINSAMQNDVNGLHTGGMMKMMDRGIQNLWIGPNTYNALPPVPTPGAFYWDMPDGRSLFVWLNASYCDGYFMFNPNWRQGPVPNSTDLRYRPPREGDIFRSDEKSILASHGLCKKNIALIEGSAAPDAELSRDGFTQNKIYGGYPYENLCVSLTSQWRIDNDPPFYPLRAFVEKWNTLGLEPQLRLVNAAQAMEYVRAETGDSLVHYSGEWPDWWANGTPSLPVELSVSRKAKRILEQAHSPVFHAESPQEALLEKAALYNACMFDEHTFGSWAGVAYPYSIEARSSRIEKDRYAYRALDYAEGLLAAKAAHLYDIKDEGIFVINPDTAPYSGWIELPVNCLRGTYTHIKNSSTGTYIPLTFVDGNGNFTRPATPENISDEDVSATFSDKLPRQKVQVWLDALPACSVMRFIPCSGAHTVLSTPAYPGPEIRTDAKGWPVYARFTDAEVPLFDTEPGGFFSVTAEGFASRWIFKDIFTAEDAQDRKRMADEQLSEIPAEYAPVIEQSEDDHELVFTQKFSHPSLAWGKRILHIDRAGKKATLVLRINRRSNLRPEIYYGSFKAPPNFRIPELSNAGQAFIPGTQQIPGSCMDYFAIDGWVRYTDAERCWLISSRDAAVVSFEQPNVSQRINQFPKDAGKVLFMLFNNTWDTNFAADSHGIMEFSFDITCGSKAEDTETRVRSLAAAPIVAVNLRNQDNC